MRIVAIASSYPRFEGDGTAPFVKEITEALTEQGHTVDIVTPFDELVDRAAHASPNPRVHRVRYVWPASLHLIGHARSLEADVKIRPISYLLLPLYIIASFVLMMRLTKNKSADLIHGHWVLPNGVVAAVVSKLRGVPLLINLHGSDIFVAKQNRIFGQVARWVFAQASVVIACSPDLRDGALALGAPPKHTHLLPYGVDPVRFQPLQANTSDATCTAVSIGRMVHKKGFSFLIDAWKVVVKQFPQATLTIAGDGPLLEPLRQQANALGLSENIVLPGQLAWDKVPAFLDSAELFILPSVYDDFGNVDGLPNVLMEAMSCGKPIVATAVAGVPTVIHNKSTGLLVEPSSADALAQAIIQLLSDEALKRSVATHARAAVLQQHSWQHFVTKLSSYVAAALA